MTSSLDLDHARQVAFEASNKAARVLREHFGRPIDTEQKGYADYVTKLDHECEEIIRQELTLFDGSIEFVGEESTEYGVQDDLIQIDIPDTCWIVDPLDGTSNYFHAFGAFCISIGLRVNKELVVGVITAPITGDCAYAQAGSGAYRVNFDGTYVPLRVEDRGNSRNIVGVALPFRYPEHNKNYAEFLTRLIPTCEDVRRVGSAALDLMWVAGGQWAQYVEYFLKPWDSAAGGLLVKEAGGIVTDCSGNETAWLTNGQVISSANARVHEQTLSLIE